MVMREDIRSSKLDMACTYPSDSRIRAAQFDSNLEICDVQASAKRCESFSKSALMRSSYAARVSDTSTSAFDVIFSTFFAHERFISAEYSLTITATRSSCDADIPSA